MILTRTTITGADESVDPDVLLEISQSWPFVEWGILVSKSKTGKGPRYPGLDWINSLRALAEHHPMNISFHVCGQWMRDMLVGEPTFVQDFGYCRLWIANRIQWNINRDEHETDEHKIASYLGHLWKQHIFQIARKETLHLMSAIGFSSRGCPYIAPMFDQSCGEGILSPEWPKPISQDTGEYDYTGYAGGLNPANLKQQLSEIARVASNCTTWIDIESGVRTKDDRFDTEAVCNCLEISANYVTEGYC